MVEWGVKVLVLAFFAWMMWSILQARYIFEIRVEAGRPTLRKGKVTPAFLSQVAAVCQEAGVVRGWIGGVPQGRRVALRFSRHFPAGSRQRLRNHWVVMG
jgi:hypothetical protein